MTKKIGCKEGGALHWRKAVEISKVSSESFNGISWMQISCVNSKDYSKKFWWKRINFVHHFGPQKGVQLQQRLGVRYVPAIFVHKIKARVSWMWKFSLLHSATTPHTFHHNRKCCKQQNTKHNHKICSTDFFTTWTEFHHLQRWSFSFNVSTFLRSGTFSFDLLLRDDVGGPVPVWVGQ